MKKLLILLSALVISGSAGAQAVSCSSGNKYDQKNNGNTIWAQLAEGIKDSSGEGLSLDSGSIWKELGFNGGDISNMPGNIKIKLTDMVMKIFNVSILVNAAQGNKFIPDYWTKGPGKTVAEFGNLKAILTNDWNKLQASANQEVQDKISSMKNSYGKKWNKHWKDFLKDYNNSVDTYKAFLYANGDDNVLSATDLIQSSLMQDQTNYSFVNSDTIKGYIDDINNGKPINDFQVIEAGLSMYNSDSTAPLFSISYNTTAAEISGEIKNNKKDYTINTTNTAATSITGEDKTDGKTTVEYYKNNLDLSGAALPGLFSPVQSFIENKWFDSEKPLAISQIVFSYDAANKFDITTDKLAKQEISNLFSTKTINSYENIFGGKYDTWDKLMKAAQLENESNSNVNGTYESTLLTTDPSSTSSTSSIQDGSSDGFGTVDMKAAVYGSVLGSSSEGNKNLGNILDPSATMLPESIESSNTVPTELQRTLGLTSKNNDMYHVYKVDKNDNVVVYFDSIGLHIVHIDGSSLIKKDNKLQPSTTSDPDYSYLTNYSNSQQYEYITKYNKAISDNNKNPEETSINTEVPYLDWLNNNQKIGEIPNAYTYSIDSNLSAFADNSSQTSAMSDWDYSVMKWYLSKDDSYNSDPDAWLNKILNFTKSTTDIKTIFKNQLEGRNASLAQSYDINLETDIANSNDKTAAYKGTNSTYDISTLLDNPNWITYVWDTVGTSSSIKNTNGESY